jgi:hypothetical protein
MRQINVRAHSGRGVDSSVRPALAIDDVQRSRLKRDIDDRIQRPDRART